MSVTARDSRSGWARAQRAPARNGLLEVELCPHPVNHPGDHEWRAIGWREPVSGGEASGFPNGGGGQGDIGKPMASRPDIIRGSAGSGDVGGVVFQGEAKLPCPGAAGKIPRRACLMHIFGHSTMAANENRANHAKNRTRCQARAARLPCLFVTTESKVATFERWP